MKVSHTEWGGGGGLQYKKEGGAHRTFSGLKKRFWYLLLGCSASRGPQRELSRELLGY